MTTKPKRPTSQQVAELAGVSRTTVSFVLNDTAGVTLPRDTRAKVLAAAEELGYVPDAAARTLASGKTQTLGLIIYDDFHLQTDAFIPNLLYSFGQVSRRHGFKVIIEALNDIQQDSYALLVQAKQIDGLLVLNPRSDDERLRDFIDEGFPTVLVGSIRHPLEHAVIHTSSAQLAVEHLLALGRQRVAHITYAPVSFRSANDRLRGYQRALKSHNLELDDALVAFGNYSAESGYEAMKTLLERTQPDALFAGNDTIALGALSAIHEEGLRVPEDIAVVGYDDIPLARFAVPPLTTVHAPVFDQGRLAGEMLIRLVKGEAVQERRIKLSSQLIVRASCGAALPSESPT